MDQYTDTKFEDLQYNNNRYNIVNTPEYSNTVRWLINNSGGIVRNRTEASLILLSIIGITVALSILLIVVFGKPSIETGGSGPSEEELKQYQLIQPL